MEAKMLKEEAKVPKDVISEFIASSSRERLLPAYRSKKLYSTTDLV
jgi:hypothetical protein